MKRTDAERLKMYEEVAKFVGLPDELEKYLVDNGFFVKPASTKYHGAYIGGLFDHSYEVMEDLIDLTKKLSIQWKNTRSPFVVGLLHDICKMDDYIDENASDIVMMGTGSAVSKEPKWIHNPSCILDGHGEKSVMMLSQFITLTEEEIFCIRFHMGAYETDKWKQWNDAIEKYESVLWTHTADMYASKVKGV